MGRLESWRTGAATYRPLLRVLNEFAKANADRESKWLNEQQAVFQTTMGLIADVMGPASFRVLDLNGTPTERVVNRALFEAQAISFSVCDQEEALKRASTLRRSIALLFGKEEFDDSIRRATGDRTRTLRRLAMTLDAFEKKAGVGVDREFFAGVTFPAA